ncbi:MAG: GAF domain-containing protein [bacterium]|nr:GAF domain-containing protein [bacterium]
MLRQQEVIRRFLEHTIKAGIIKDLKGGFIFAVGDTCITHLCERFCESLEACPDCPIDLIHISTPIVIDSKHIAIVFVPSRRLSEDIPEEKIKERLTKLELQERKEEFIDAYKNIPLISKELVKDVQSQIESAAEIISFFMKSEELEIINDMLVKINSSGYDFKKVLQIITDKSREITSADRSCLLLLDPVTNELSREFHCKEFERIKEHCHKHVSPEEGAIGHVFKAGESLLIPDTEKEERWLFSKDVGSTLNVPLMHNEKIIGAIHVASHNKNTFHSWHERILTALAQEASIVVNNARSIQGTTKVLTSLQETGTSLTSEIELTPLLGTIAKKAIEILGADALAIYTYNSELDEFQLEIVFGVNEPNKMSGPINSRKSNILKAIEKAGDHFADDAKNDKIMSGEFVNRENIKSSAVLLLKSGDKVIGIMFVNYRNTHYFPEEEKTMYRLFALQAAVALKNACFFKEIEIQRQKTTVLYEVSTIIQNETDLDKMFYTILSGITIGEGLGFNRAMLFLRDERRNILEGRMAIGPISGEEARQMWEDAITNKVTFSDYLLRYEREKEFLLDSEINRIVRRKVISLDTQSIFIQSLMERKPLNLKEVSPEIKGLLGDLAADAFAIVPLIGKDKAMGVIITDRKYDQKPITSFDIELLSVFANQAAIAIEKTTLFEKLNSRIKNLDEFYRSMVKKIGETYDLEAFLMAIGSIISETLRMNWSIYLYEEERERLILKVCKGIEIDERILVPTELKIGEGTIGIVAQTREQITGDTFIGIPIQKKEEFLGVMMVIKPPSKYIEPFNEEEKRFVEVVVGYMTLVMTNLNLIQRLEKETKAKSEILYHLSHTLMTPLSNLDMYAKKLIESCMDSDKMKKYLITIAQQVRVYREIVENMVNFSLIETGRMEIVKEELDLSGVIKKSVALFSQALKEKGLEIKENITTSIKIPIDRVKIGTVLQNLISNAIKFSDEKKEIEINLSEKIDAVQIEVVNYGRPIPEPERKRIFEGFYRAKPGEGEMPKGGMGLGLTIARSYIKTHNGNIWVESNPEERKTKFIFTLPKI